MEFFTLESFSFGAESKVHHPRELFTKAIGVVKLTVGGDPHLDAVGGFAGGIRRKNTDIVKEGFTHTVENEGHAESVAVGGQCQVDGVPGPAAAESERVLNTFAHTLKTLLGVELLPPHLDHQRTAVGTGGGDHALCHKGEGVDPFALFRLQGDGLADLVGKHGEGLYHILHRIRSLDAG